MGFQSCCKPQYSQLRQRHALLHVDQDSVKARMLKVLLEKPVADDVSVVSTLSMHKG